MLSALILYHYVLAVIVSFLFADLTSFLLAPDACLSNHKHHGNCREMKYIPVLYVQIYNNFHRSLSEALREGLGHHFRERPCIVLPPHSTTILSSIERFRLIQFPRHLKVIAQVLQSMSQHKHGCFLTTEGQAYVQYPFQRMIFLESFSFLPGLMIEQRVNLAL